MKRKRTCDPGRRGALRLLAGLPLLPAAISAACSKKGERTSVSLPAGGNPGAAAVPAAGGPAAQAAAVAPSGVPWAGKFSAYDLADRLGFAALRRGGLWIDVGTTDAFKYTLGGWKSGWGRAVERDGGWCGHATTDSSRLFFPWPTSEDIVIRMRVRRAGAESVSLYANDNSRPSQSADIPAGDWAVVSLRVAAANVIAGENRMLLRWSGTQDIGGEAVAALVDWFHVASASSAETASDAEPLSQAVVRSTAGGTAKVLVPAGGGLSYSLDVPTEAPVRGLMAAAAGGAATLAVRATTDGEAPKVLAEVQVSGTDPKATAVDLAPFAGKVIRLDLDAAGAGVTLVSSGVFVEPRAVDAAVLGRLGKVTARNVIHVMIDTLRADHVPPYGRTRVQAKVLELVAQRGALFERFSAVEDWTKPSCATMLTGLYPNTHKAQTDDIMLSPSVRMISEELKAKGLQTASFIANGYVSDKFGFKRGWDQYTNYIREGKPTTADRVFGDAAAWIEAHKAERFYAYVHTIDPHVPYSPPAEFLALYDDKPYDGPIVARQTHLQVEDIKKKKMTVTDRDKERLEALYDGEISFHDGHLGSFLKKLDELGILEETLVIVSSDHGEEFWDHGSVGHGHSIFQELVHVPFFLMWKNVIPAGVRIGENHDHTCIVPTVFEALGLPPPGYLEGLSVLGQALGRQEVGPSAGFSTHQGDRMAVWSGRYKFQLSGAVRGALFDLVEDPHSAEDRDDQRPIAVRWMRTLLGAHLGSPDKRFWRHVDLSRANVGEVQAEAAQMDAQTLCQLCQLGYVVGERCQNCGAPAGGG
ncbi:MAG: sulfatase [Deltaproteobacteria bacterium]|nr:sulfatase [Deltaproteobacteria bacterium]